MECSEPDIHPGGLVTPSDQHLDAPAWMFEKVLNQEVQERSY